MLRSALRLHGRSIAIAGGVALSAYLLHQHSLPVVKAAEPSDAHIFVINGFYMAMREKYTKPGESISYYLVEWDPKKLSWEDFRGKVLGATDPATAEEGSLRREIFSQWKSLGLKSDGEVTKLVAPRGWTVEGDLVKITKNDDNTAKPKRDDAGEAMSAAQMQKILACVATAAQP